MKVIRFVATEDRGSRFTELDIPIENEKKFEEGHILYVSNGFVSPDVRFVEVPEGVDTGWHGAPRRQIVIIRSGVLEVSTGDGENRQWCAGEVFLADDVEGKHQTRVVEGPVRYMSAQLPSDFGIENWSV